MGDGNFVIKILELPNNIVQIFYSCFQDLLKYCENKLSDSFMFWTYQKFKIILWYGC